MTVGLVNLGNTCYLNSVVQCLLHCDAIHDYLINCPGQLADTPEHSLVRSLAELATSLDEAAENGRQYLTPRNLTRAVCYDHNLFEPYRQQVTSRCKGHEVGAVLIRNAPSINAVPRCSAPDEQARRNRKQESIVSQLFAGATRGSIECLHCGHVSSCVESFHDLSLQIPGSEASTGWGNVFHGKAPLFSARLTWSRFKCHSRYAFGYTAFLPWCRRCGGLCDFVDTVGWCCRLEFPVTDVLDLSPYCDTTSDTAAAQDIATLGADYVLAGVVTHMGSQATSGHYMAYCRDTETNQWYRYDDSDVHEVSASDVSNRLPYMLFYRRHSPHAQEQVDRLLTGLPESDQGEPLAYLSHEWLTLWRHCVQPPPVNDFEFMCSHGAVQPHKASQLLDYAQERQRTRVQAALRELSSPDACAEMHDDLNAGRPFFVISSAWEQQLCDFSQSTSPDEVCPPIDHQKWFDEQGRIKATVDDILRGGVSQVTAAFWEDML
ncbi:uncharacterized protein MONBRDRAFT_5793, partial [Monosiga brevicollis MX1]